MTRPALICFVAIACIVTLALAQQSGQSPLKESSVKMSGKTISLKYSAPSMNGRKIFGALVPHNQVWLVGDGSAVASFHTDADLEVQGLPVPRGEYTLYVIPDSKEFELVINKQMAPQAMKYNQKLDLGRVPMDMKKAGAPVETLRMTVTGLGTVAGKLELAWEDTVASVPFNIDNLKANPEW